MTSGRNPGACPPDLHGIDVGVGVGADFGVGVGINVSQHKSGQGSGDIVPSGANEESAVLRSDATQRGWGSSLDELENNRNISVPEAFQALGRRRGCGKWTVAGRLPDGTLVLHRVNCKCWGCCYCGPRKAKKYRYLIGQIAEREGLNRFLTLTLDPSKIRGDSTRYLRKVFNKFRLYLTRKFGKTPKYIAVLEFHKSGIAHMHLLLDQFIPWEWIRKSWEALGGGTFVNIKFVDVHRIARYLSKYLTKELLLSAPERARRITTSRTIKLIAKGVEEQKWALLKASIFLLYSRWWQNASDISLDEDGILQSFMVSQLA